MSHRHHSEKHGHGTGGAMIKLLMVAVLIIVALGATFLIAHNMGLTDVPAADAAPVTVESTDIPPPSLIGWTYTAIFRAAAHVSEAANPPRNLQIVSPAASPTPRPAPGGRVVTQ